MRSVDVVLPASMCAMIPMLRVSSSLNALAIILKKPFLPWNCYALHSALFCFRKRTSCKTRGSNDSPLHLPAVMGESLVGFGHAVHVFLLLDRAAAGICRVDYFFGEFVDHGLASSIARILQQPANRQGLTAERVHFHRHLIVGAAHPPGLHFDNRLEV